MEARVIISIIASTIVKPFMHKLFKSVHYSCPPSVHWLLILSEATSAITLRIRRVTVINKVHIALEILTIKNYVPQSLSPRVFLVNKTTRNKYQGRVTEAL